MARIAAGLFLVLLLKLPAHATLVALVPARDGLAIAADSRLTFLGVQCDGAFKILEPARLPRTVAVVTGDSFFVAPPPAGASAPCRYLATAPRLLDIGGVVTEYLDRTAAAGGRLSDAPLAAACVAAVERFRREYPAALRGYAGREIFSVAVASYDPAQAASTVRNFVVRIDPKSGRAQAARLRRFTLSARSAPGIWIFGETSYVNRYVYSGPGRHFLSASTLAFFRGRETIGAVPLRAAAAAAANVVGAASRTAESIPAPSGIGGAIHVLVLSSGPRPEVFSLTANH